MVRKLSRGDIGYLAVCYLVTTLAGLMCLYPLLHVLFSSFSEGEALARHTGVMFRPAGFSLRGYQLVLKNRNIPIGYFNTLLNMALGTALNMLMTVVGAYALSRKGYMFRRTINLLIVFTMYFSGGLIPLYLQVKNLGLYNSPLAMIIPSAISIYNVLILRSFFMYGVPKSLEEAALLDGANTAQMLWRVILPLVKPTLAVLVLYYAIGHWNDYFSALIFLKDKELMPLQTILRDVLITGKIDMASSGMEMEAVIQKLKTAQTLKYSVIVVSTVPLMLVYPFIQKYFVKGIMLGAVKG